VAGILRVGQGQQLIIGGQIVAVDVFHSVCYRSAIDGSDRKAELDFAKDVGLAEKRRVGRIDRIGSEAELLKQETRRMIIVVDFGDKNLNIEMRGCVAHQHAKRVGSATGTTRRRVGDHDGDFGMTGVKMRMKIKIDIAQQRAIGRQSDDECEFGGVQKPGLLVLQLLVKRERLGSGEAKKVRIRHPSVIGRHMRLHVGKKNDAFADKSSVLIETHLKKIIWNPSYLDDVVTVVVVTVVVVVEIVVQVVSI
jgi:hypothetical protein